MSPVPADVSVSHPAARFGPDRDTLVVFLVAFPALAVALNLLETLPVTDAVPGFASLRTALGMAVLAALTVALLRRDGVSVRSLGLHTRLAGPALLAVVALWTTLNLVAVAGAVGTGTTDALGFFYDRPLAAIVATVVVQYGFVAVGEELAVRGFLQNKLVAVLGGPETGRVRAAGIVLAAVTFGVLHVPDRLLTDGLAVGATVGSVLALAATGVAFGVIYDLTRNLYLVVFLHGTGNFYPLFVDLRALPDDAQAAFNVARVLGYVALVAAYRLWGPTPGESQQATRSDTAPGTD